MASSEIQLPLAAIDARKVSILSRLAIHGSLNKMGISFPQGMTRQSWEAIGSQLKNVSNSSVWWLADWMIHGESSYGSQYRDAIERTGLDYQTLRNYAWVARRFEHNRRRETLSFAHHAEVARLPAAEQDYWLRKAEQQSWSCKELRKQVRASMAEREIVPLPPPNTSGTASASSAPGGRGAAQQDATGGSNGSAGQATTLQIDLPVSEFDQITKIAESFGLSRNDWAARVLQSALRNLAGGDVSAPVA
ncbi:LmbU family transcriptional regulator [Streptomyces sp. G45]|uniref:LmbU family transcriptional regulator n=1 Tax=Streptomyces sp. G45 TaxID=3406627 RepID=UPI003C292F38